MTQLVRRAALAILLLVTTGGLFPASVAAQEEAEASARQVEPDREESLSERVERSEAFRRDFRTLRDEIDKILAGSDVTEGTVGIHVEELETGRVYYTQNGDTPMNPASNVKLMTSAAALDTFGPQHTFGTELLAEAIGDDGTVDGALYVRGDGEAFLLYEDVLEWAGKLRQKGVRRIAGDIVIDDGVFDRAYLPPGFDQKDEDASYRSPIGAVSVNFNAVTAVVEPGSGPGEPARCRLEPPNEHVELVNEASTVHGPGHEIQVRSEPTDDGTRLVVSGKIGHNAGPFEAKKRIDNPPQFAGAVFADALELVGIEHDGQIRTGETPEDIETLVSHDSHPLSWVVMAMNKWSNNFMAEQLLRALGVDDDEPSTWDTSREALDDFLEKAELDTEKVTIQNGSGLYDGNLVSPRDFVALLQFMHRHTNAPEFKSSLAIAGVDGTLEDRLTSSHTAGNVRAKTGTLNEVSSLSGYLTTRGGHDLAFSILINDPPKRAWHYRPVSDQIVEAIVDVGADAE
ncbi:MAG: D-alanyl-D-alanine carboxypeptidase/D-alanyl-D-alanine-endopeptidase [Persicimonas sp.]